MVKKYFITAISVIILLAALAGCGGKETTTTTEVDAQATVTPTATDNTRITETPEQITIPPPGMDITFPAYTPAATPIPRELMEQKLLEKLIASEEAYNALEFPDAIENEILYKFMVWTDNGGHYVVVYPATTLNHITQEDKEDIVTWFADSGYDISSLYDRLLELNENRSLLPIKSSIKEGFFINYNSKFEKYLSEVGGEVIDEFIHNQTNVLEAFYVISPHYSGHVEVSMPAYDPETGYVLVYRGWHGGGLLGFGRLYLMKYEGGVLTEITLIEIWVS